ncbi:MAG: hypothetical protein HY960_11020 [Ignavibacteriae bacterium]|nr:hypothetical protein [Ignavibacteriota bacterium]
MNKKTLFEKFLTVFGDIKIFKWPLFLLYDPGGYLIKGKDIRCVINLVKPGDILLRGFKNYLDGYFIPGYFSHAGLYVGRILPEDARHVTNEKGEQVFQAGEQMVIHSMAEGVFVEDVLNFCRCDYMAIMRFPDYIKPDARITLPLVPQKEFSNEEIDIVTKLKSGVSVPFQDVFPIVKRIALGCLGKEYDFKFDFENFHSLSCSELIYYCIKSFGSHLDIRTVKKRVLFLFEKTLLEPDAFLRSKLEMIWKSPTINERKLRQCIKS